MSEHITVGRFYLVSAPFGRSFATKKTSPAGGVFSICPKTTFFRTSVIDWLPAALSGGERSGALEANLTLRRAGRTR